MKTKLYVILICILTLALLTSCVSADAKAGKEFGAGAADFPETIFAHRAPLLGTVYWTGWAVFYLYPLKFAKGS